MRTGTRGEKSAPDSRDHQEDRQPVEWTSFNEVPQWRAQHQGDLPAFVYLADGERETHRLTFAELDRQARWVAAWLQEQALIGERVLLLYPPGLDFVIGFLGCLYAGSVAVPAYPPHPRRVDPRLMSIMEDCRPSAALCVQSDHEHLCGSLADRHLKILATDSVSQPGEPWTERAVDLDALAYLQYTSGSTGEPKGVMVSHRNLLHQAQYLLGICQYDTTSVHVSWQPFFHDMGLVGSLVEPIFSGAMAVIMSPAAFLRNPIRWLEAISRYRGTGVTAPNFAYDLCVKGTTPAQREGLDLSSWAGAWNGAEPILADVLDRFSEVYEPYGFRPTTHLPSYGMAETTLCVTASRLDRLPVIAHFRGTALEQNRVEPCAADEVSAVRLVGSGIAGGGLEVAIVDPATLRRSRDGSIGEIWVSGPSVAQGYWQRPELTEATFNAHIAESNEGPYLRTGDLGFLHEGELFVTGRLKDMIIIRGRNLYPQDLELVAQRSHKALQANACAAFSVEIDGKEELAVALEVTRTGRHHLDADEVFEVVRRAIGEHSGVAVHWLGLVQPNGIPRTSSGKVMRRACRQRHLSGDLSLLAEWRSDARDERQDVPAPVDDGMLERLRSLLPSARHQVLVRHLQQEIAVALEIRALPDPHMGFERLGIDSMGAVELVNRLHEQLEGVVELPTTLLFDEPNIDAVARFIEHALFGLPDEVAVPDRAEQTLDEPIAVVGLACRFPAARDAEAFWRVLDEGIDAVREVPADRWDISQYFDADPSAVGKMSTRFGGFVEGIDGFDAAFFDISPREAVSMDPQHRQLLEVSWQALEHAGIAPTTLDGRPVGVFVGISTGDYQHMLADQGPQFTDAFMATGTAPSAAVGRVSFLLGLQGPCISVDTACSSSLVAVHLAVQSLRAGECEAALAGGVNAVLRPDITVAFSKAGILAPDGRCRPFDDAADGYVRGEGCGVVVLKRLRDAERDGDNVLAVIRGSAVNQDGRSSGLTAPNGPSQTRVIASALAVGGVSPADVQYLECHGTGTVLGDPIEVQAANAILGRGRAPEHPCLIGSVKSNLGHLEAAAGIAGLIKVVLALQHDTIPRSLHFHTPNARIPWHALAVQVAAQPVPWPPGARKRLAGVSSFGFAGTNAHVVLEEAPRQQSEQAGAESEQTAETRLLALSARSEKALADLAGRYAAWLEAHHESRLADICHTANVGRNHFEYRAALLCNSIDNAREQLAGLARGEARPATIRGGVPRETRPRVVFLFPGQGLQYAGMARELYDKAPAFRACLDRCAAVYDEFGREDGSPSLIEVMFDPNGAERLRQTRFVQPALYALQVSLAALWRSWGVVPDTVLGHSAGEYAAACVAGAFDVEAGLKLILERARLMQTLPAGGTMLSVTASAATVEAMLADDSATSVSAYNGLNTVISGPAGRLDALMQRCDEQGLYCQKLPASNAFHSHEVDPILDQFEAFARGIEYTAMTGQLISTMTGAPIAFGEVLDATYWRNQARRPVRFTQAVQSLFETVGCDVALELGPQAELIWLAQMCWRPEHKVLWTSSLAKNKNAREQMLSAAAQLYANGMALDFAAMEGASPSRRTRLALPAYPFQQQRYWPDGGFAARRGPNLRHLLFDLEWQVSAPGREDASRFEHRTWLILGAANGIAGDLVGRLEAMGSRVLLAELPADRAAIPACLQEAAGDQTRPLQGVLHLWSLGDDTAPDSLEALKAAEERGVLSALALAQHLMRDQIRAELWLVTQGVHRILESDQVNATHAPLWGLGKSLALGLGHPEILRGMLDLPRGGDAATLVPQICQALKADDYEDHIALRQGQRWVARLQPAADQAPAKTMSLDAAGSYLITGGLGAIGLHVAERLAKRGVRHLVLTGRSAAGAAALQTISALEEQGCAVRTLQVDVTQEQDVTRLFDELAKSSLPPLVGLIHAAGTTDAVGIDELSSDRFNAIMAPKVWGAWLLDREVRARKLDLSMFVCMSSMAALWGAPGQAHYASANIYLDALMSARQAEGMAGLSVNYGPWQGPGVAANQEAREFHQRIGLREIDPAVALDALEAIICSGVSQMAVADVDWNTFIPVAEAQRPRPLLEGWAGTPVHAATEARDESSIALARLRTAPEAERVGLLATTIRSAVAQILKIELDELDEDVSWFTLGMNSLMAVEVTNHLRRFLGQGAVTAQLVFEHPTIGQLATVLAQSLDVDGTGVPAAADAAASDRGTEASDCLEFPATVGQTGMWFLQQVAPTSRHFNLPVAVRFARAIRLELLERALRELMLRHDALRTTFEMRDGQLLQVVQKHLMPMLRVVDLRDHASPEADLRKLQEGEAQKLFDLTHGSLVRFTLVTLAEQDHVLMISMHHAISDGASLRVLLDEFLTLHEALAKGEKLSLPAPEAQFGAYAAFERRKLDARTVEDDVAYWRSELNGIPPLELPSDRVRPAVHTQNGDAVLFELSAELSARVHECSRSAGVTPFVTLLAAWSLLLNRYSGQSDFGIGASVAGRDGPQWGRVIGFFLNMLTLRVRLDQDWTVRELLAHVAAVTKGAYAHQSLPIEWLIEQLNPPREPSRTPLFQSALTLQVPTHEFEARMDAAGMRIIDLRPARLASQFDTTLFLEETSQGFKGFLEYNTDLFDRWRTEQMVAHFKTLLSALTSQPDSAVAALPLLSPEEQQYLLSEWNQSAQQFPMDRCVHELIVERARRDPRRIAVVCKEQRLTYRDLNERSNQLAHHLRSHGVGPGTLVGLCLDRSPAMVIGVLGVIKAGGAYVPLDPSFPKQRLQLMLDDANVAVLVTQVASLDWLPELEAVVVCVDRDAERIAAESTRDLAPVAKLEDPYCVLYTSGSTGRPKGVVVTHRSLLNFLLSMGEKTEFTSADVIVAVTTLSFDISKLELLLPLLHGARAVIATLEETRDGQRLQQVLREHNATIMQATPSTWRMLLASGWTNPERIRVLCGGEAMNQDLAKSLLDVTACLWNVYGPTETTIWSTIHRVRQADRPTAPIGYPIANTQIYILDERLQPVPIGVPGELYIGGDGLAWGYLNQPELTAERFVRDPFTQRSGARMYRTGDLCQRLPDGNIEYLGRSDQQVKVRGFRIEIGDIEAAMAACTGVRQAAVRTWKGRDGLDFLVGYVVADPDHPPAIADLKAALRDKLPDYMVPGMFMLVDEFPLTPNKKVDRRALPSPEQVRELAQHEFVAPTTEAQKTLAEVWREVLDVERVGIHDNFFELGGHSLLIVSILTRLKQQFDVEISIGDLYQNPTVEALAAHLELGGGARGRSAAVGAAVSPAEVHHQVGEGPAYTYRQYRAGDKGPAIAALRESYGDGFARNAEKTFDWKYLENPLTPASGPMLDILECDDRIVGMNGRIPVRFKIGQDELPGVWNADTHVVPDHRGVSVWFAYQANRIAPKVSLGMPSPNNYAILSAANAVIDVGRFTELKACLDLGPVLKAKGINAALSSICGGVFSVVPRLVSFYAKLRAETDVLVEEVDRFDSRLDDLWQSVFRDYEGTMVRDQRFLSWRFDRCPNREYTRYVAERNGEIVGYMVTRHFRWGGFGRGRIVDYLVRPQDTAALNSLLERATQDFAARGIVSVICSVFTTNRDQLQEFRRHGFLYSRPGSQICIDRSSLADSLAAIKNWFFTYADGDIDYCDDYSELERGEGG